MKIDNMLLFDDNFTKNISIQRCSNKNFPIHASYGVNG